MSSHVLEDEEYVDYYFLSSFDQVRLLTLQHHLYLQKVMKTSACRCVFHFSDFLLCSTLCDLNIDR